MTLDTSTSAGTHRAVLVCIDRLCGLVAPPLAFGHALGVITLRGVWERHRGRFGALVDTPWTGLVTSARSSTAQPAIPGTVWMALSDCWYSSIHEVPGVEVDTYVQPEYARLGLVAEEVLAQLIIAVDRCTELVQLFDICLDRYSKRYGRGGEYYTPLRLASLMVDLTAPIRGERVLDPACGSGRLLVAAAQRAEAFGALDGRDVSAAARHVAALNAVLHDLPSDLGAGPVDSLRSAHGPGTGYDVVLCNPPFNDAAAVYDPLPSHGRWRFGDPPRGRANFAWVQHVLSVLNQDGRAVVLLGDGAAKGVSTGERKIRQGLVDGGHVVAVVALPSGVFPHTRIPACLWLLAGTGRAGREVLFIDARRRGTGRDPLPDDLTALISRTVGAQWWAADQKTRHPPEEDWCTTAPPEGIAERNYNLTPSRYVPRAPAAERPASAAARQEVFRSFNEAAQLDSALRVLLEES